eukprot:452617-Rhodomonas_salina.1
MCYIDADTAQLYCWGSNYGGQMNGVYIGKPLHSGAPKTYAAPTLIELPTDRFAVNVQSGGQFSTICVVLDDFTVKCSGRDGRKVPEFGPDPWTSSNRQENGVKAVPTSLFVSELHSCFVEYPEETRVNCRGMPEWQLDVDFTFPSRVRGLYGYYLGTFAVLQDNSVYQWGQYIHNGGQFFRTGLYRSTDELGNSPHYRWYPTKHILSIIPVAKLDICFQFADYTYSCMGQSMSTYKIAPTPTYNNFPELDFRALGGPDEKVVMLAAQGNHFHTRRMYLMYESQQLAWVSMYYNPVLILIDTPITTPFSPIIDIRIIDVSSPILIVRENGVWQAVEWSAPTADLHDIMAGFHNLVQPAPVTVPCSSSAAPRKCSCTVCTPCAAG